ncbi:thioester reductase domain-containing protein [Jatrophihabitans endophyticus]|uniref:Thioester reductase domain-containing protein n=1 Tax=Jatrophihabitans endophyticus TaxID=1206085 RepID=A0A1M5K5P7_9ACTN|nr:SDR family oxidoreductase [Jatrophihabitans endophyticus]SHG48167.1 thioester reductase domain-containing protein [Jatrophihabitans endophyticus]
MGYFVTGATGFIGRFLLAELLDHREGPIYCLCRAGSLDRIDELKSRLGDEHDRIVPVVGDLTRERLGVTAEDIEKLTGDVEHFFHLAAIYDITADADTQRVANVEGTRHALDLAAAVEAAHFHQTSSIAVAGLYRGVFTEDMFEEAQDVAHNPYYLTKHEAEAVVRRETRVPWRVYRPGAVVGHSETGEIDKVDGPYYFFKTIQRVRSLTPSWLRGVGLEGGEINLVPVDFVAKAMDHLAHVADLDGRTFHLTDPEPMTVGGLLKALTKAAKAPQPSVNIDARALDALPARLTSSLTRLPGARQLTDLALAELGIPRESFAYLTYPTHFDSTKTRDLLAEAGIECPPFALYAQHLWEYWERTYSPDRRKDKQLARAIKGKTVMITGASSGIGRATALRVGAAGARVVLVARGVEKLEQTRIEIEDLGGTAFVHRCDLADLSDIERMAKEVLQEHGRVDVLVNNAGRSIRRSIALSYDRMHDYERTMQLNYFGPVRLVLSLLPVMRQTSPDGRKGGHIINVSSIGVQTNIPRFSAYVASKAALDAFSRCIASEVIDDGVHLTTIHMPLVRTPMIAPTKMYDRFPTMTPPEAADLICKAMIRKPKKVGTAMGNAGALAYQVAPKGVDVVLNAGYKLFPDSHAARGGAKKDDQPSTESVAFAHILRGVHW